MVESAVGALRAIHRTHAAATEFLDQLPWAGAQVAAIRTALAALVANRFGGEITEAGQAGVVEAQRPTQVTDQVGVNRCAGGDEVVLRLAL